MLWRREKSDRLGFTLIELLVVMTIIAILVALLLPAVQMAREAAHRAKCSNNLRQVGLALQNYHTHWEMFPAGGITAAQGTAGWGNGHTWWVGILPLIEQNNAYAAWNYGNATSRTTGRLFFTADPNLGQRGNVANYNLLKGKNFPFLFCPSSGLVKINDVANSLTTTPTGIDTVQLSMYMGITGAANHRTAREKWVCYSNSAYGILSWGGMLLNPGLGRAPGPACGSATGATDPMMVPRPVRMGQVTDGASNTVIVGEQSDFVKGCSASDPDALYDRRSDCESGFTLGPENTNYDRQWNITTVLHPIGERNCIAYGIQGNCGPNRPVLSAHIGGAYLLFVDGGVRFLSDGTSVQVWYDLANRDDGNNIPASVFD